MSVNIFEKASRKKMRFASSVGFITAEDLWDLPLTSSVGKPNLNDIAKGVARQLKDLDEDDFVGNASPETKSFELGLDIIKHIIGVKQEENAAKVDGKLNEQKKEKIRGILEKKRDAKLEDMSEEDLEAML